MDSSSVTQERGRIRGLYTDTNEEQILSIYTAMSIP
jgi:hypothetical protein